MMPENLLSAAQHVLAHGLAGDGRDRLEKAVNAAGRATPITLCDVVATGLAAHGFDGLWNATCGCALGYLIPGDCLSCDCVPGWECSLPEPERCENCLCEDALAAGVESVICSVPPDKRGKKEANPDG